MEPRKNLPPGCRRCKEKRKAPPVASISREASGPRAVRAPVHVRKHPAREPGDPVLARRGWNGGTHREVQGRTAVTNEHGKSDRPTVPAKPPSPKWASGWGRSLVDTSATTACRGTNRLCTSSVSRSGDSGTARCRGAARTAEYAGTGCGGSSTAGCIQAVCATPLPRGDLASSPEAGAQCGKAARWDLWRGLWATMIPTPTPGGGGSERKQGYASQTRLAVAPATLGKEDTQVAATEVPWGEPSCPHAAAREIPLRAPGFTGTSPPRRLVAASLF